jgi:hypothetical protein
MQFLSFNIYGLKVFLGSEFAEEYQFIDWPIVFHYTLVEFDLF